jgi:hypothetical protein
LVVLAMCLSRFRSNAKRLHIVPTKYLYISFHFHNKELLQNYLIYANGIFKLFSLRGFNYIKQQRNIEQGA